jgi:hypothetical protein
MAVCLVSKELEKIQKEPRYISQTFSVRIAGVPAEI